MFRLVPFRSNNGVRPKKSIPDLGAGDFPPIRSVLGAARAVLGMSRGGARTSITSGVARVSRVINATTTDTITAAAINIDSGDAVDVTNIAVNADSGVRSI